MLIISIILGVISYIVVGAAMRGYIWGTRDIDKCSMRYEEESMASNEAIWGGILWPLVLLTYLIGPILVMKASSFGEQLASKKNSKFLAKKEKERLAILELEKVNKEIEDALYPNNLRMVK